MHTAPDGDGRTTQRALRLWLGVALVSVEWLLWAVLPLLAPQSTLVSVAGGFVGGLLVFVWWAFLSRAPRAERWGVLALLVLAAAATSRLVHVSIRTGMMGMMFLIYAVPVFSLALVAWAVATRRMPDGRRRAALVATILVACGGWMLVRTEGVTGDARSELHWRWTQTAEERLLAASGDEPRPRPPVAAATPPGVGSEEREAATPAPSPRPPGASGTAPGREEARAEAATPERSRAAEAEWPGFRGPARDGVVRRLRIATDWTTSPPAELWRRPIGPGWSSFAVGGGRLYTQEQRGEDEVVGCYDVATGEPVWRHRDPARFWESNAGAGPRATPALGRGRVFTLGATGIVNALHADTGAVAWSRNAASDAGKKVPGWGFAASPLLVGDLVVVAAAGRLVAYDAASGAPRWVGPDGGGGYSSPHLATIAGVPQVLLLSGKGAASVAPSDGVLLWQHAWGGDGILEPAIVGDSDVIIASGSGLGDDAGVGTRRLAVGRGPGGWTAEERWTSSALKPYYNDLVVHDGYAFGFDGSILACIDLADGTRKWKGGRYGHGQLVLLAEQGLLLVLSEEGELAIVAAAADRFREIARHPALEGKTWNHPALAGDVLLVRNGEEMAAFRVALASSARR